MEDKKKLEHIKDVYYNAKSPGSYGGVDRLYKALKSSGKYKFTKKEVKHFLSQEYTYTAYTRKNRAKKFNPIVSPSHGYQIDADVGYLRTGGKISLFLLAVDVFSRKIGGRVLPNLKGRTVEVALRSVLDEMGSIEHIRTDRGTDFQNKWVSELLEEKSIQHIIGFPPNKAVFAERYIQVFKNRLYKNIVKKGKKDWSGDFQDMIQAHNNTKLTALGNRTPNEVVGSRKAEVSLWFERKRKSLLNAPEPKPYRFKIGDAVRYKVASSNFDKDYQQKNSSAIYRIVQRHAPDNIARYKLKNIENQILEGSFTQNQLEMVDINEQTMYRIEKELGKRIRKGVKQVKVRWEGYGANQDTWIDAKDVEVLK